VGSCLLGLFFALPFALLIYSFVHQKAEALIAFLALALLFTRIILWSWERAKKEHADSVRRWYKTGRFR